MEEIELTIKDKLTDGVFAVSLVENPAIEANFLHLSSDVVQLKVIDEERRIVVGFALIPEKRIPRKIKDKVFNIYFSKETISETQELFMSQMKGNNFTTDHNQKVQGIAVIESWIVEDPKHDKSNIYNLGANGGEWVLMSKINNDKVWADVKAGKFKGYSIEAMFSGFEDLEMSEDEKLIKELRRILGE